MSQGIKYLHSHSGIERELKYPKHIVLVDEEYIGVFSELLDLKKIKCNGKFYIEVPIMEFVFKGGVFKNLLE